MSSNPTPTTSANPVPVKASSSADKKEAKGPAQSLVEGVVVAFALTAWRAGVKAASTHWKHAVVASTAFLLGGSATIISPWSSPKAPASATETWYGLSRELKNAECSSGPVSAEEIDAVLSDDKRYNFYYDLWELRIADGAFSGGLRSVEEPQKLAATVSGFFAKGDFFAGSMKGVKGRGVYLLQADRNQEYYFGRQIALDCGVGVILSCPYILGSQSMLVKLQQESSFITTTRCRRE